MRPCFCSRCHPTAAREQCSACGEEIRYGVREGVTAFHHRLAADHVTTHGHVARLPVSNMLEVAEESDEDDEGAMGPPEIAAHPVDHSDFAPQSGLRQVANLVTGETRLMPSGKTSKSKKHPPAAPGWELVSLTHSRGHYMGAKGGSLGISDAHVLRARGPVEVDGTRRVAVASWRDLKFDFAFIGTIRDGRLTNTLRVSSTEMKDWILGHDVPEPVLEPGE